MKQWFKKAASLMREVVGDGAFLAKLKFTELWHGGIAARELAAAKFLRDNASPLLEVDYVAILPRYQQFVSDVRDLASKAELPMPKISVLLGYGGEQLQGSPAMLTSDQMVVPEVAFFAFDSKELRAIAGHELGHVKNGDMFKSPTIFPRRRHHEEYAADAFSSRITDDPDSMISFLRKIGIDSRNTSDSLAHPRVANRIKRLEELKSDRAKCFVDRLTGRSPEPNGPGYVR
jgi:Zn-dependent protease with chaperone function